MTIRTPDPKANTTTEAYLAYKAGYLQENELKPVLYEPYLHFDAWLAYWAGLTDVFPMKKTDGKNLLPVFELSDAAKAVGIKITGKGVCMSDDPTGDNRAWRYDGGNWYLKLPAGTYTISETFIKQCTWGSGDMRIYDSAGTMIARAYPNFLNVDSCSNTFTLNDDTDICVMLKIGDGECYVQLEEGATATPYVPYSVPEMLCDEEALVAYLSGVTNTYPEEIKDPYDVRIVGYLKHLVSIRWPEPDYPVNNSEFYLSTMKPAFVSSGDPSADIELDDTAEAPFIDLKMYGDSEQRNLPKGYTQVLGIRAVQSAYIDIATTIGTDGSFEYSYSISTAKAPVQWGYRGGVNFDSVNSFNGSFTGEGTFIIFAVSTSSDTTTTRTTGLLEPDTRLDFKYDGDTRTASIPGYTFIKSSGFAPDIEPPQNHFVLNGAYVTSTNSYIASTAGNIIYRFKSAECDIYPCVRDSDGTVGLYDVKRNIFIPPTAGTFTVVTGDVVPTPDTPIPVQVVTGEQTVKVTGKNLMPYPYNGTGYGQGITFTANSDGSVTLNGANNNTGNSAYYLYRDDSLPLVFEAGTYYFIPPSDANVGYVMYDGTSYYDFSNANNYSQTFSSAKSIHLIYVQVRRGNTTVFNNLKVYPMLTTLPNQTATAYEPYQAQSYKINLGKNLFDVNGDFTYGGYSNQTTKNGDGSITTSSNFSRSRCSGQKLNLLANTTYTLSCNMTATTSTQPNKGIVEIMKGIRNVNMSVVARGYAASIGEVTFTFTTPEDVSEIWVSFNSNGAATSTFADIQIEQGSTATTYAPYFTPIELCKIGDYQDYIYKSGEDWYIHREIDKLDMSTITGWSRSNSGFYKTGFNSYISYQCYSNIFTYSSTTWESGGKIGITSAANLWITFNGWDSIQAGDVPQWLSGKNALLYGVLATPTNTKITDATLIAQLDALMEGGSYEDKTFIKVTATDPNLPGLLYVEAGKYD